MWIFTLAVAALVVTLLAVPVFFAVIGVRQFRWWNGTHPHQAGLWRLRRSSA